MRTMEKTAFPRWHSGKESNCRCKRHGFNPWVRKIPWRIQWQPTPVFLPRESHGQRSLASYSAWGCKETDMTEHIYTYTHTHTHTHTHTAPFTTYINDSGFNGNNETLHSTELLRTFWKHVTCLVIPTDTIKNSERVQLKNHMQSAINYIGTPYLSGTMLLCGK